MRREDIMGGCWRCALARACGVVILLDVWAKAGDSLYWLTWGWGAGAVAWGGAA